MALAQLDLQMSDVQLPQEVVDWIGVCRGRIELFWDRFPERPLSQYVECDFELVCQAIAACLNRNWVDGRLFVEWGCGFGVVTGAASLLGLDAIGIEVEHFLCQQSEQLFTECSIAAEIWQGNFLPNGARDFAEDSDPIVSLSHTVSAVYDEHELPLDDFAMVYAYPWPGEEHFLRLVFDRFARVDCLLLMYRGPFHIELYRKIR